MEREKREDLITYFEGEQGFPEEIGLTLDGDPDHLRQQLPELIGVLDRGGRIRVEIDPACEEAVRRGRELVEQAASSEEAVYGVNTGFGKLATLRIEEERLSELQHNLLLSHHVGHGDPVPESVVRLAMVLKLANLLTGRSGVRLKLCQRVAELINQPWYPRVPRRGSVGASGDLAPLAACFLPLIGHGEALLDGVLHRVETLVGLKRWQPMELSAKEGLALINGIQMSLSWALVAHYRAERLAKAGVLAGALAVEAYKGSITPFSNLLNSLSGQPWQERVAASLHQLIEGSEILESHRHCSRVQDPYCLRCMPQVLASVLAGLEQARSILDRAVGTVSDNPLVIWEEGRLVSGGNFHGQLVAQAADQIAAAMAELVNIFERQLDLLLDEKRSGLPPFLAGEPGITSGLMLTQTATAEIAAISRILATPLRVHSLPTGAGQEDLVPMATYGAERAHLLTDFARAGLAYLGMAAVNAIRLHRPLRSTEKLELALSYLDEAVPDTREGDFAPARHLLEVARRLTVAAERLVDLSPAKAG